GVTGTCTDGAGAPDPTCATDAAGVVKYTYKDVKGVGEDTVNAAATIERIVEERSGESASRGAALVQKITEQATAFQTWTPAPAATPAPAVKPAAAAAAGVAAFTAAVPPKGTARTASVRGCIAASSYLAAVRGTSIASVTYTLDGRKLKTLRRPTSRGAFALRIKVRPGSAHHLAMRVVFTASSKTAARTLRRTVARCAARRIPTPRFTG